MDHLPTHRLITLNVHLNPGGTDTQTETSCAATVREHGNRENPSGQKTPTPAENPSFKKYFFLFS
jgi:hypothetical protein